MRFTILRNKGMKSPVAGDRKGFTLLETMLSIALLLVLTIIIYQGFVATMQISKNSALYSKSGSKAAGNVYTQMATTTVDASYTPVYAIHLQYDSNNPTDPTHYKNLGIVLCTSSPTTNTNYGDTAFRESTTLSSTKRHGFVYCGKALS